jgi:uncharacterized membrane protein
MTELVSLLKLNLAHVHLLLNHFPTIGFAVGLGLFLVSFFEKRDELRRTSLVIFFLIALVSIPTYLSGNGAFEAIKDQPGLSAALVHSHESAAMVALLFMELTGFVAWLALWQYRRSSRLVRWNLPAVLVLAIVTFGFMVNAANIGGQIRHPEIQAAQLPAAEQAAGTTWVLSLGEWVIDNSWVWPACESLHFVGLCLLFSVVLLVDLRMLGVGKRLSFANLHQLLPLGMLGFALNFVTGMMFFVSTPAQYTQNIAFHWKVILMLLAGLNVLYFMLFDGPWKVGPGDNAPLTAKVAAASAILLWGGVLYFGHMLPFIGNAF